MSTNGSGASTSARYRELGPLGSGGMATVALAEDTVLRRRVALKRLHTSAGQRELVRLRREALVGASLNHRNLVAVYDVYGEADGQLVIVMEYVAGETLHQAIRANGAIAPRRALEILGQLAAGLDAIHARGVVHRDVKPANVLLGTGGEVKLADLGIAAAADRTQTTAGAELAGTFSYMAPEQLEGRASSATIDVYALAAVAFEMLSGRKARQEANPVALAHAISTRPPPDLRAEWPGAPAMAAAVLHRGMAANPAERPRSAGALVARLAEALEPQATEVATPPAPDVRRPAAPKRPASGADRGVKRPAPGAAVAVARRIPRAQPPARRADGAPSSRGAAAGGSTGLGPVKRQAVLGGSAPRRPPSGSSRARVGALLALVLVAIVVALAGAFGLGGAGQRATKTRKTGAAASTHVGRSGASAHSSPPAREPVAQSQSASSAAATSQAHVASALKTPVASAPQTPAATVQAFYGYAARHEYAAAWRLADANMRNQLAGFASFQAQQSAVRSITFHRAQTLAGSGESSSSATVALQTTAVLADRTEQCGGTARLVGSATAGWLLDRISINCTP